MIGLIMQHTAKIVIIALLIVGGGSAGTFAQSNSTPQNAFDESLKQNFPMSRSQINRFKQRLDETKRNLPGNSSPVMGTQTRRLSFETGNKPPVLRIAPGYVTTLAFVDSTGSPWPVSSVTLGNPNFYKVVQPSGEKHIITVSALKEYVDSNLALTFQGKHMPVTIQLKTVSGKQESTDSLVVFKTDRRGPNAREPTFGPTPEPTASKVMMNFLDRVPPGSAKRMELSPRIGGVSMWSYEGSLYVRTEYSVMWPAWKAVSRGPNKVRVYEMPRVSSLMVSREGRSVSIQVEGEVEHGE